MVWHKMMLWMTAPESKLFPASDRYHKRKIKTDDSVQRVYLYGWQVWTWPWACCPYIAPWTMSEASGGALDPWILLKLLNLIAGVWCAQICVQQVGQPSQKTRRRVLVKFLPGADSCLSIHLSRAPSIKCRKCLRIWMGYRPRRAQTPPGPHSAAHPPCMLCLNPVVPRLNLNSDFTTTFLNSRAQWARDRKTHGHRESHRFLWALRLLHPKTGVIVGRLSLEHI